MNRSKRIAKITKLFNDNLDTNMILPATFETDARIHELMKELDKMTDEELRHFAFFLSGRLEGSYTNW